MIVIGVLCFLIVFLAFRSYQMRKRIKIIIGILDRQTKSMKKMLVRIENLEPEKPDFFQAKEGVSCMEIDCPYCNDPKSATLTSLGYFCQSCKRSWSNPQK